MLSFTRVATSRAAAGALSAAAAGARLPSIGGAHPLLGAWTRSLFIRVEETPNPDSIKFLPEGREVLPEKFGTGLHFNGESDTRGAKFVRNLLKYKEVTGVFLGRDFVSVNKVEDASWAALKPIVLDNLMDAFAESDSKGVGLVEEVQQAEDTRVTEEDDEVVAMIKELLETRIRPAVQEDGGDILYKGFNADTGIVKVQLAGSCVGCPSSSATLRNGVEGMLTYYIPEVRGIEEVKDVTEKVSDKEFDTLEARLKAAGAE